MTGQNGHSTAAGGIGTIDTERGVDHRQYAHPCRSRAKRCRVSNPLHLQTYLPLSHGSIQAEAATGAVVEVVGADASTLGSAATVSVLASVPTGPLVVVVAASSVPVVVVVVSGTASSMPATGAAAVSVGLASVSLGGAGGAEESFAGPEWGLTDLLALRASARNLLPFLPSPSVPSVSDVVSRFRSLGSTDLRSFRPVIVPKNDERRRSLRSPDPFVSSVVVAGPSMTADVEVSVAGSAVPAVVVVSVFGVSSFLGCTMHVNRIASQIRQAAYLSVLRSEKAAQSAL